MVLETVTNRWKGKVQRLKRGCSIQRTNESLHAQLYIHLRSGGVVGYHVCLTRTRSRVRSSSRVLSFFGFVLCLLSISSDSLTTEILTSLTWTPFLRMG